jgi:hypothetical protein
MSKRTRRRPQRTALPVRWGCVQHQTPAGRDCRWCATQGVLFARTDATRRKT